MGHYELELIDNTYAIPVATIQKHFPHIYDPSLAKSTQISLKLYTLNPLSDCCAAIKCVADELGLKMEIKCVEEDFMKSKEFKEMSFTNNLPILQTAEGCLQEPSAIIKYLCLLNGKMLGCNDYERSLVDQWLAYVNTTMRRTIKQVNMGIFGTGEITNAAW